SSTAAGRDGNSVRGSSPSCLLLGVLAPVWDHGRKASLLTPGSLLSPPSRRQRRRWRLRVRSPVTVAGPCRTRTGFLDSFTPCLCAQHSRETSTRQTLRPFAARRYAPRQHVTALRASTCQHAS